MTDEELLKYQLRNPPVMSMALSRNHLYTMMVERMNEAADRIEQLVAINEQLNEKIKKLDKLVYNSYCDGYIEAWDCPWISSGYTFTWESSETYKALKEITGNTDDQ
jgi:predicted transglutaminase-like cysteine proteinase